MQNDTFDAIIDMIDGAPVLQAELEEMAQSETTEITYSVTFEPYTDNTGEVLAFIGPQPECKTCGGEGEYETEYGPRGCLRCNSRVILTWPLETAVFYCLSAAGAASRYPDAEGYRRIPQIVLLTECRWLQCP